MPYNRYQPFQFLKGQMWDPAQSDQKSVPNPVKFCDHVPSTHVPPCLVIFYTRISRGPSQHKKWILKQHVRVPPQHPKAQHENQLPMYEPLPSPRQSHSQNDPKTLPGPRPILSAASTVAPAEISCSTTAAWPFSAAQCSGVQPRAPRMRRGRRGGCGCRRETRR